MAWTTTALDLGLPDLPVRRPRQRRATATMSAKVLPNTDAPKVDALRPAHWSRSVALDPKHRPQVPFRPSSTVRREWWRWPQEAHLLDLRGRRYRRLLVSEIARLQSFDPSWFDVPGVDDLDKIRAIGDAVPPALAAPVLRALVEVGGIDVGCSIEICAGSGGLALGAASLGFEHQLLVDRWPVSGKILRHEKPWNRDKVAVADIRDFDFRPYKDGIDLLSGGPPCQPWSAGGLRQGFDDERDLLGEIHKTVGVLAPKAFLFENVPGLLTEANRGYLRQILDNLRRPRRGLRYGVAVALLDAADFGVPQRRRRVIIVGIRNAPSSRVFRVFDEVQASATHHSPGTWVAGRKVWNTVSSVIDESAVDPSSWFEWPYGDALDG